MLFDQVLRDGQSEAQATELPRRSAVGLTKAFEYLREKSWGDADPGVVHVEAQPGALDAAP